jgi:sugar/nucleoside kinase (ribokinase family)
MPKKNPLVVVGTVAIDALETPFGKRDRVFGGSASYFSYAASFFTPVALVANVGQDFPAEYRSVLQERSIDLSHLEVSEGKTFFWKGKYETDLNSAITLETQLNVLTQFSPKLKFDSSPDFLFLANIDPNLQIQVLDQISKPTTKFVACDTMNFWITSQKSELLKLLSRVDGIVMNDGEARLLTGENNLIRAAQKIKQMGPSAVIIKKGEHGALVFYESHFFAVPAYPLEEVYDPTGAGDTFAGGMMGYLASLGELNFENLKKAVVMGSMVASFTVEDFGLDRLRRLKLPEIQERLALFKKICNFS